MLFIVYIIRVIINGVVFIFYIEVVLKRAQNGAVFVKTALI
jgi:hypothetical protein